MYPSRPHLFTCIRCHMVTCGTHNTLKSFLVEHKAKHTQQNLGLSVLQTCHTDYTHISSYFRVSETVIISILTQYNEQCRLNNQKYTERPDIKMLNMGTRLRHLTQGYTNPGQQVAVETKYRIVAPNYGGFSVWNCSGHHSGAYILRKLVHP